MGAFDLRPRFYEGQYLVADDLSAVVDYLRTSQARHALGAHSWGIGIGLALVERSAPGAPNRVEVILQPGWGRDGFGRHLTVQQPTRLPETLFAGIAYNASIDDPSNPGGPTGRLVKVWLAYTETDARQAPPGFETCNGPSFSRVEEGVEFIVGSPPLTGQRAPVVIGAETVDARDALIRFDAGAPPLYDTTVPHQTFAIGLKPPRWLVPLGYVRYVAVQVGAGYFVDRAMVTADNVAERIRAARRYGGTVTENIEATDGVIVLRRRSDAPDAPHRFAALLTTGQLLPALLQDLVWVEGNLRVEGDAKLAGSRLLLRNADGLDEGTDFYLSRQGDGNPTPGARQLRAVIGIDSQTDNRFVVGPEVAGAPGAPPGQKPVLVVQSNGRIGINFLDPARTLHARGDAIRIEDAAGVKRLEMRTDGAAVDLQSDTDALYIRSSGLAATHHNQVLINPFKATDGEVGIGTATPAYGLDVDEAAVRFKLDTGNGGQLLLRSESVGAAKDKVYLEASNGAGNAASPEVRITGPLGANVPTFAAYADTSYLRGKLGVNEPAPAADTQVHVRGARVRLQSVDSARSVDLRTDGSDVDLQSTTSHLFLRSTRVGGPPTRHVVINPFADDGNVGIGTTAPAQKLHVGGDFLRVDGLGQEQAYIGGDGTLSIHGGWPFLAPDVQIGSFNAAVHAVHFWNIGSARWMDIICDGSYELSDEAAKSDIRPIGKGLDAIARLRGVSYHLRGDPSARVRVGVVAQEVAPVLPEAVAQTSRGAAVAYSSFVPVLIEAVKELKAQVEALRAEVDALRAGPPSSPAAEDSSADTPADTEPSTPGSGKSPPVASQPGPKKRKR
jgi:hypothetical protein